MSWLIFIQHIQIRIETVAWLMSFVKLRITQGYTKFKKLAIRRTNQAIYATQ